MEEFLVNDTVMHCRDGLATITGTTSMGGRDYFLVRSNKQDGETVYVPFATAGSIIRHVMDVSRADAILRKLKNDIKEFNANTKQRRDTIKRKLSSGDVNEIAYLYRQFYYYEADPEGVKLGPADIDMFTIATNMFLDEMALTFNKKREEISSFIIERIKSL